MDNRKEWKLFRDELVSAIISLGFPGEFGDQIAKQLGSPKAMQRMCSYLNNVKPHSAEIIADEMLSIRTEIDRWKEKKKRMMMEFLLLVQFLLKTALKSLWQQSL